MDVFAYIAIAVLAILAMVVLFVRVAKHQSGSVHGDFRFDKHKGLETSKRGLFDRTKWR